MRVRDRAGNVSEPVAYEFAVDSSSPLGSAISDEESALDALGAGQRLDARTLVQRSLSSLNLENSAARERIRLCAGPPRRADIDTLADLLRVKGRKIAIVALLKVPGLAALAQRQLELALEDERGGLARGGR